MSEIDAIYEGGVFKPMTQVMLRDHQRVRLQIQPIEERDARTWLELVEKLHRQILQTRPPFPDATLDIAADRAR